jgi:Tol biopolymer transport system component
VLGILLLSGAPCHKAQTASVARCHSSTAENPLQLTFPKGRELGAVPSPDRSMLAFEYFHPEHSNIPQIWVMDLAQGFKSARPLVDDDNYNSWPSWSPDSKWVSFMSGKEITGGHTLTDQIYKVKVGDRTIVQLTHFPKETVLGDSTSWSPDGRIAFEYDNNIYAVDASGENETKLIDLKSVLAPGSLWGIEWSPDGSHLAFRGTPLGSSSGQKRIWLADAPGRQIFPVTQGPRDENPSWLDNEHILFERWNKEGEVRVCILCLSTSKIKCLTQGHVDLGPTGDARGHAIFFARGEIPHKDINAWFPETHIWTMTVQRTPIRK